MWPCILSGLQRSRCYKLRLYSYSMSSTRSGPHAEAQTAEIRRVCTSAKKVGDPWQGLKQTAQRLLPRCSQVYCITECSIAPLMFANNNPLRPTCTLMYKQHAAARHACPDCDVVICLNLCNWSTEAGTGAQEGWQTTEHMFHRLRRSRCCARGPPQVCLRNRTGATLAQGSKSGGTAGHSTL